MRDKILSLLPPDYPWGQELLYLQETDSTNTQLKAMARQGAPEGTALIARQQTGGRGRLGRSFQSDRGGVYMSLLLRPRCPAQQLMHLTCAAAVAMCDAVEDACGLKAGIKWTNDLVFGGKKLGGILTELGFDSRGEVEYAIIGIGINCCQKQEDFPPQLRTMALSLSEAAGEPVCPELLAAKMLQRLLLLSRELFAEKKALLDRYRSRCVTLGREVSLLRGDEVRHARALDITEDGALTVLLPDGRTENIGSGEVSVRGMYGYL